MKELETKLKEIKSIVDDLLKEIENKPLLTKKQRWHLQQDLDYYRKATGHEYVYVQYAGSPFALWNRVIFYYTSKRTGEERYDLLGGNPCYTEKMESYTKYTLEELGVE